MGMMIFKTQQGWTKGETNKKSYDPELGVLRDPEYRARVRALQVGCGRLLIDEMREMCREEEGVQAEPKGK